MNELWSVEFSLVADNIIDTDTPSVDGELVVIGTDIFDVLQKAKSRLRTFGYGHMIIHGANRSGFEREKGAKENE